MKTSIFIKLFYAFSISIFFISCEDFVEIDTPSHRIVGDAVFNDEESAQSVIQGIYNQLIRTDYSDGGVNSVTTLAGLSADNIGLLRETDLTFLEFDQHEILPDNNRNFAIWSSSYNVIYMANSIIEGLIDSELEMGVRNTLEGEAKFIRAFTYFYLTNLYNDIPLLLTTDYIENSIAPRNSQAEIYQQIIVDLEEAIELLPLEYRNGERINANRFTALALLARVHLYEGNWSQAEALSSEIISQTGQYEILDSLDQVFLPNSKEALWQISPIGRGNSLTHTYEGSNFILNPGNPASLYFKLDESLIALFEPEDLRYSAWIGYHEEMNIHYPFKYKDRYSIDNITEYSMVMRLAEQYLIRAEARAMQDDLIGASSDINFLRMRAGIDQLTEEDSLDQETILEIIMEERRKELFSEWGHRWFDLKRTGKTTEVLSSNPLWNATDEWYPIPEQERIKNTNLTQNPGY
ncbi:RagB/SusD family nutrient uptake outer membrane protein [Salegentibacter flavus]|uniref:SusD family protein n=1 Tax=Salegentibacter flavus TaxID=287099 RepID=A0A1I5DJE0_9FLAO|nr:RagB/SusD family nutrient uptake outer membrane protein [Salegentibacter flavus]SFN99342.1 SusD family protein [Salegentibacter flavus]